MTIDTADRAREKGIALVYVGVFLVPLLLCTGLAVDLGRGYLVRANLAKAVDAAALAAAHNITAADSSQAQRVADNIFHANFPLGFLGVNPSGPDMQTTFGSDGSHIIAVSSTAIVPTTFMRLAGRDSLRVAATATATRRLVDMAFVIDRSGSLLGAIHEVQAAAMQFVGYFDQLADRIALITFSSGTTVATEDLSSTRGFKLATIDDAIAGTDAKGGTATAEALYQAWDQLRAVPYGSQSGLRIVVLFTDGSPNSFPGKFQVMSQTPSGCTSTLWPKNPAVGTLATYDYRFVPPGNNSTTNFPDDVGLFDTHAAGVPYVQPTDTPGGKYHSGPSADLRKQNLCIPYLPQQSFHDKQVSSGIPTSFQLYLPGQRWLDQLPGGYPNYWLNANHAARNLAETIANAIRNDTDGLNRIRIYTLGLGDLLLASEGSAPAETGASILQRIANDPASSDHNPAQLDGRFFFAADPAQLNAAFQAVHDEVVRLSQ